MISKYRHKEGYITLFNQHGRMMVRKRYATVWQRRKIIERWENFYLDRFNRYYYQISPDMHQAKKGIKVYG